MLSNHSIEERIRIAEERLGISFSDRELLVRALTHRSFSFEAGVREMNEKLEFLGDTVLNLIITEFIFYRFPEHNEGDLAKLRARIVNASTLARVAQEIGLGDLILMGKGAELTGGRERASILGDTFEAIIGAIYIDQGMTETKSFILTRMKETIFEEASAEHYGDPKTRLQEVVMSRIGVVPEYRIVSELGPVHDRTFVVDVVIEGEVRGEGEGKSKKKAEQEAAKAALRRYE
ncbi:MAG: ribonuclease III [Actinobacteria bacterium]|nr:ribonuclease III [Actinomycetota bacterium]